MVSVAYTVEKQLHFWFLWLRRKRPCIIPRWDKTGSNCWREATTLALRSENYSTKKFDEKLGHSQRSIRRPSAKTRFLWMLTFPTRKRGLVGPKKSLKGTYNSCRHQRVYSQVFQPVRPLHPEETEGDIKMPSRRAAKTPKLTEKMKSERFKFESTHKHWTYDESSQGDW